MGASAFLKSVDFRAFEINVKTIAPTQNLSEKTIVTLATSGGSGMGNTNRELAVYCPGAQLPNKPGYYFPADTVALCGKNRHFFRCGSIWCEDIRVGSFHTDRPVLPGRHTLVLPEFADKITEIIKSYGKRNIGNRKL